MGKICGQCNKDGRYVVFIYWRKFEKPISKYRVADKVKFIISTMRIHPYSMVEYFRNTLEKDGYIDGFGEYICCTEECIEKLKEILSKMYNFEETDEKKDKEIEKEYMDNQVRLCRDYLEREQEHKVYIPNIRFEGSDKYSKDINKKWEILKNIKG